MLAAHMSRRENPCRDFREFFFVDSHSHRGFSPVDKVTQN